MTPTRRDQAIDILREARNGLQQIQSSAERAERLSRRLVSGTEFELAEELERYAELVESSEYQGLIIETNAHLEWIDEKLRAEQEVRRTA